MNINNGRSHNFIANLSMVSVKGENVHNHQFINIETKKDTFINIQIPLDRQKYHVSGVMNIATNGNLNWTQIRTKFSLYNYNTIVIDFDLNEFIGQPIYGIVE